VVGELLEVPEAGYQAMLGKLDRLEGLDSGMYSRTVVECHLDKGVVKEGWVYTGNREFLEKVSTAVLKVPSGDWAHFMTHRFGASGVGAADDWMEG
jgi:gamma-glutamylcyclotransferase (GGCT)/AIG2-like uncharacterized protein YtfP